MSLSDPIGDMIARVKNAHARKQRIGGEIICKVF